MPNALKVIEIDFEKALDGVKKLAADDLTSFDIGMKKYLDNPVVAEPEVFSVLITMQETIEGAIKTGLSFKEIKNYLPNTIQVHSYSGFGNLIQNWPHTNGVPGDWRAIEMIVYQHDSAPKGTVGYHLGMAALRSAVALQHIKKLEAQAGIVKEVCENNLNSPVIVSIACGASHDLERIQAELIRSRAKIILIDMDKEALENSVNNLFHLKDQVELIHGNVLRAAPKLVKKLQGAQVDCMLCGGLFDYLDQKILKFFLPRYASLLNKNAPFFFTNIDEGYPLRWWMEGPANWPLIARNKEQMHDIAHMGGLTMKKLCKEEYNLTWLAHASRV